MFAAARQAKVVMTFPNILRNAISFEDNAVVFADLIRRLDSVGIRTIGSAEANAFDLDVVFDTTSHQTSKGQAIATDRLVKELRRAGLI